MLFLAQCQVVLGWIGMSQLTLCCTLISLWCFFNWQSLVTSGESPDPFKLYKASLFMVYGMKSEKGTSNHDSEKLCVNV